MKAGITGNQNLGNLETVAWVVENLKNAIAEYQIQHGFTSLAIGVHQLFTETLRELNLSYTAIIPCREYEKTFQTPETLENYRILRQHETAAMALDFGTPTEAAFMAAGKRVIDLADFIIAVWNGQPAKGLGGTGDAVKYVLSQKKSVFYFDRITKQVAKLLK